MKRLLCIALLAAAGVAAAADDLAQANRLLAEQAYDKALPLYRKLAEAGNPEAQMRLGELYWFGDGTTADLALAKRWFERSAAAGNADAAASLASLKRRETRGQEITYWTTAYQGEDLRAGACKRPQLPAVSQTRAQIQQTGKMIADWHACYNRFVDSVNDALPPGKRIPADVVDMMTPAEGKQAQKHLDAVYSKLISEAQEEAKRFASEEAAWHGATEAYVKTESIRNDGGRDEIERMQTMRRQVGYTVRNVTPPPAQ
ncbi:tetratricopeptide repeat protein [uncultured Massilia sp.]|uniref:tetratricopeptide repeat protein n=1 Tax=uncultured Massilia sp. TaxID=169973 RepID=UPI0025FF05E4|nr:sel1 repeat family protein [uncultured Massilia sp.]